MTNSQFKHFYLWLLFLCIFQSPGRGIIKPIAFKPVVANQKQVNQTKAYHADHPRKFSSHDDGYGSQDYGVTNQNMVNVSHGSGSSHMDCDR